MVNDLAKPSLILGIALGAIALISSIYYVSTYLAIVGFAMVFWSATLLYVIPSGKRSFLPSAKNIEKTLIDYNLNGKGVYLPPKKKTDSVTLFIPASDSTDESGSINTGKHKKDGVYLTPPGQALCRVFEQQIGAPFTKMNLEQFKIIFPKLLTDYFEFAHSVYIQTDKEIVTVGITENRLRHVCQTLNDYPRTHRQVGCLLTSATACVLVKVTGEPITIQDETNEANGTLMQFKILKRQED
jgi:hypothetical protein